MSKDLTEALRNLMSQNEANIVPAPNKDRGAAPAVKSSALLPGTSSPSGNSTFAAKGTKTMATSDGLFTMYYPETLETVMGPTTYTLGVIKKVTV